jgi:hypothetical protein
MQAVRALPPPVDQIPGAHDWRDSGKSQGAYANAGPNAGERNRERDRFRLISGGAEAQSDGPHAKSFRFRVDPDARNRSDGIVSPFRETPSPPDDVQTPAPNAGARKDAYNGLAIGDPSRNAATFLASLIAQTRLGQGLDHSPHAQASQAYRVAGAKPPLPDNSPKFFSVVA